jgi:hypothetical protein
MDISVAEPPENVAQQGLDNITNGPIWIVSTKGNIERVRRISGVDDRAAIVRANAIPPREDSGKAQLLQKELADKGL